MSELHEYHQNLMADIRREADASGVLMVEAFFDRMVERITESGELEVADRAFYEHGEGAKRVRIDGFAGDPRESDGVLGLIVCDFSESDEVRKFEKTDLPRLLNPLIRFLNQARSASFREGLNEVNPGFQVSDLIARRWSEITKVKLILISNRQYTGRDDAVKLSSVGETPVTYSVWDLVRFERFDRYGQVREDMVVDFVQEFGGPLPALRAYQTGAALESYLAIVPGNYLAAIYDKWGARLLEANVRSFLQASGKTNKGIQATIRNEPEHFFPYNNGLSATAESVTCVEAKGGLGISRIANLQIVNGAQTTGSIHAVMKSMKDQLRKVFVQMKLTIVPSDQAEAIVPKISQYANTQNKVNAADFFSNHPFHIQMEKLSRALIFPPKEGERHESKWFYERSRGQYRNERSKRTPAEQKKFDLEFPKAQLFSKTDLAKFEFSASSRPHVVSKGAQKNFAEFAKEIGESWTKHEDNFDEMWFRRFIAKALMFRTIEAEVSKQSWYAGGYRANIVTYSVAKLFHDVKEAGQVLDLDSISRRQMLPAPLLEALLQAAERANHVITNPPIGVRNMSEWAKQQACWHQLKSLVIAYDNDFGLFCTSAEDARRSLREARSSKTIADGIHAQSTVVQMGAGPWKDVLEWGKVRKLLSPDDIKVLQVCAAIPRRVPTDFQSQHALAILERVKGSGFEVRGANMRR